VKKVVSKNAEETERLGVEIAQKLNPGGIIGFTGGLGSGKTCIIKAICRGLGVSDVVTSPTFTLMHIYDSHIPVLHLDCYRLRSAEEAELLGIDEYFNKSYICLIEWVDRIRRAVPENIITINMSRIPERETWRTITIDGL